MILPQGRSATYLIWRACERLGLMPPGLKEEFGDNNMWAQALIMAYHQIREIEETKWQAALAGAKIGV